MELDERKLRILKTIIDDYILTALPVGSRTISKRSDIGLSSATIRNEMSDLEEMGYLDQPHTSAGRIPSDKAYRLYVNHLMKRSGLNKEQAKQFRGYAERRIGEAEEIISQTARMLSHMTKLTSMVMAPEFKRITMKHIQLVPMSDGCALAIIVTDAGQVHDTLIRIPSGYGSNELQKFSAMLTEHLAGKTFENAIAALVEYAHSIGDENRAFFDEVTSAISHNLGMPKERFIALDGTTNLLMYPEYSDVNKARAMLSVLETKENIFKLLSRAPSMEFTITIGAENEMEEMKESSVVTATYEIGGSPVGSFGVIGPTRMDYSSVITVLNEIGASLSEIFSNMLGIDDNRRE